VEAIEREKQLKAGSRNKKFNLSIDMNPEWKDIGIIPVDRKGYIFGRRLNGNRIRGIYSPLCYVLYYGALHLLLFT
jgi:hypothetical protein